MAKVDGLLKTFAKTYKKDIGVMGIRDDEPTRVLTGFLPLDIATGGGVPEGRVTLLFGPQSATKTTTALKIVRGFQRKYPDRTAAFVDIEGHLDRNWAKKMGVDVDKLAHIIPENAEQAVDIIESLLAAEDISCVVVDSLAAMQIQADLDKSAEDVNPGKQAFIINRLYRKVTHALNEARVEGGFMPTLIVINQIRFKIGAGKYEDPETMPGGPAFLFVASLILRMYGRDEGEAPHNKKLPAFKKVSYICRKHKIPIIAKSCEVFMALHPNPELGLAVGEVNTWPTMLKYLKAFDLFRKAEGKAGGWDLTDPTTGEVTTFKTQDDLRVKLRDDANYSDHLTSALIYVIRTSEGVIDAEE